MNEHPIPGSEAGQSERRRLAIVFVIMPLVAAPIFWTSSRLSADSKLLAHSNEVLESLYSARAALRQSVIALHAFLRTSDEGILASYQASVKAAWREVWHFKELTADNPRQVASAPRLEQRMADLFRFQDELIARRRLGPERDTEARMASESKMDDTLRVVTGDPIDEERRLLELRLQGMQRSIRTMELTTAISFALLLLLEWIAYSRAVRVFPRSGTWRDHPGPAVPRR